MPSEDPKKGKEITKTISYKLEFTDCAYLTYVIQNL